jgi:hypothetical protein
MENLYEELADVYIMLEQVMMSLDKDRVQSYVNSKLERLEQRLNET